MMSKMNKIPKCNSKISMYQPYIKVTKKDSLEKNSFSINTTNGNTNNEKFSHKKQKQNDSSIRKFGNDISLKVKNHPPMNVINPTIGKVVSKEKVNKNNFIIFFNNF